MSQSPLIMIIRHGEKPTDELAGVHPNGDKSENCLISRGWQRAGALVPFFSKPMSPKVSVPTLLIAANRKASGADTKDKSLREEQTLSALSESLQHPINVSCGKGMESEVAALAIGHPGPVLICWDHNKIMDLAKLISSDPAIPDNWDSNRFDLVLVFRAHSGRSGYDFEQVPQLLLPGDLSVTMA